MSPTEEPDAAAAADLARRRREVAKRLHPDRGGDPEAFTAAMAELDAAAAPAGDRATGPASDARAPAGVRVTMRGRLRRLQRRAARKVSRRRFIEVPSAPPPRPVQRSEET